MGQTFCQKRPEFKSYPYHGKFEKSTVKFIHAGLRIFKILSGLIPIFFLLFLYSDNIRGFNLALGFYLIVATGLYLLLNGIKNKKEVSVRNIEREIGLGDKTENLPLETSPETQKNIDHAILITQQKNRRRKRFFTFSAVVLFAIITLCIFYFTRPAKTLKETGVVAAPVQNEDESNQTEPNQTVENTQPSPPTDNQPQTDLSEQQTSDSINNKDSSANNQPMPSKDDYSDNYIVQDSASYFYSKPDYDYKRKGYVLSGDTVQIKNMSDDGLWGYAIYTSPNGSVTTGWLLMKTLQKAVE